MSTEDNKHLVRRYYDELFTTKNLAALDDLFAPAFVGHSSTHGDFTLADMRRDIVREHTDMPEDETVIERQIAEGDDVVTRWLYRWQHDVSLFGEPPTGQWLTMHGVHTDRIADGKIAERWEVKDFWSVVIALGGEASFPPPSTAVAPER